MINIFEVFTITTRATILFRKLHKTLLDVSSEILFEVFLIAFNSSVVVVVVVERHKKKSHGFKSGEYGDHSIPR